MNDYKVNDIVYVAIPNKLEILPAQIVEKIVVESADGTNISFKLRFPGQSDLVSTSSIKNIFFNLEQAKLVLIERFTQSIELMCARASDMERALLLREQPLITPADDISSTNQIGSNLPDNIKNELITLSNGQQARLRLKS